MATTSLRDTQDRRLAFDGKDYARCRLRLCFANPETIRQGVAVLAEVCRREFGIPLRSANMEKN